MKIGPKSEVFLEILAMLYKTLKEDETLQENQQISEEIMKTLVFKAFLDFFSENEEI